jgi:pimeloyl-ACP methyl ester carboxylesterase
MAILKVHHRTSCRHSQSVEFGEHRLMSRPRDSHDLPGDALDVRGDGLRHSSRTRRAEARTRRVAHRTHLSANLRTVLMQWVNNGFMTDRGVVLRQIGFGVLVLFLLGAPCAYAACSPERVDVGGYRLWMQVAGKGEPTVVFESGGGNDSSAWASVEPQIREQASVRTVLYDRAGLGKSEPNPGPYAIDHEVAALERALHKCGVRGPLVVVSHSYGGFVSTLMAAADRHVVGMVLVDANLGSFFDKAEVDSILSKYTPQFDAFRKAKPELARVMIPLMEAYPETATRVRSVALPLTLPVIDIVAEKTWADTPEELASMRRAHADFVAASPAREAVFASGSGHYVMRDRPEVVIDAVERMVKRVREK